MEVKLATQSRTWEVTFGELHKLCAGADSCWFLSYTLVIEELFDDGDINQTFKHCGHYATAKGKIDKRKSPRVTSLYIPTCEERLKFELQIAKAIGDETLINGCQECLNDYKNYQNELVERILRGRE